MTKIEMETSSGNIFADLGIPEPEEALIQADLALAIGRRISHEGWTQKQAAEVLGVRQSDVSNIVRGKLKGFSIERLVRLLRSLNCEIQVVVKDKQASEPTWFSKGTQMEVSSRTSSTLFRGPRNIPFMPRIEVETVPLAKVKEG